MQPDITCPVTVFQAFGISEGFGMRDDQVKCLVMVLLDRVYFLACVLSAQLIMGLIGGPGNSAPCCRHRGGTAGPASACQRRRSL